MIDILVPIAYSFPNIGKLTVILFVFFAGWFSGKPIDLSEWEKTPAHLRMTYGILKSAGYSPREVYTKREISELKAILENETDQEKKARLVKKLNALDITNALQMERLSKN